jgi:transcriptional regulator with XRE-family HTH domain
MATVEHDCRDFREEFQATIDSPYHFVDSGLENLYLVGIKYFRCKCGQELADIPAIKQLLNLIARDVVEQPFALSGDEIRFLRKRLGKKQADFSKQLGLEIETLSRIENGHLPASERTDKFIRLYYALASKDPVLLGQMQEDLDARLATWQRIMPPKKIVATVTDNEWTADLVAA